jgi:ABC-type transport system involved in multi-copper enzyme maturation permease subunit
MGIVLIARFTIQEAFHRWLLCAMLLLNLLLLVFFALVLHSAYTSMAASPATQDQNTSQITLLIFNVGVSILSMWAVYLLCGALTIVLTIGMTSGEIEAGTFAMIITKPLRRLDIIFGKWLGCALIVCVYTAMLWGSFLGVIYWFTGYWPQQAFQTLEMLELSSLVLLALTTLGSACVPTLVNGAIAIVLFIVAPLAGFIQLIATKPSATTQNIATAISLIIPTDAIWHGASFYLIPPALFQLIPGQVVQELKTPFTSMQPTAPSLIAWAILYCIVLPIIGAVRFQRRDL